MKLAFVLFICLLKLSVNFVVASDAGQIDVFRRFATDSWKSAKHSGDETIEQKLVRVFSGSEWGPGGTPQKIAPPIGALDEVGAIMRPDSLSIPIPSNDDSPRSWIDNLELREIVKFQAIKPTVVDEGNFDTDDLVKAYALSGTFWVVYGDGTEPIRPFSGLLVPGQSFHQPSFQVHTCMHGFIDGNATNGISYYFVPNGVAVDTDPTSRHFVTKKGFKVVFVRPFQKEGIDSTLPIDSEYFNKRADMRINEIYQQTDYALATIEKCTEDGTPFVNIISSSRLGIQASTGRLPELDQGDIESRGEWIFNIGLKPDNLVPEPLSVVISAGLKAEGISHAYRRSLNDDETIKKPMLIGSRLDQAAAHLASYPGMSGGPILRCHLAAAVARKKCAVIGTLWGGERIFDESGNLVGFRNFINLLP